jgi:hypothetical protein
MRRLSWSHILGRKFFLCLYSYNLGSVWGRGGRVILSLKVEWIHLFVVLYTNQIMFSIKTVGRIRKKSPAKS